MDFTESMDSIFLHLNIYIYRERLYKLYNNSRRTHSSYGYHTPPFEYIYIVYIDGLTSPFKSGFQQEVGPFCSVIKLVEIWWIPSRVNVNSLRTGKSPFGIGKSTITMSHFQ